MQEDWHRRLRPLDREGSKVAGGGAMTARTVVLLTAVGMLSGCGGPTILSAAPGGGGLEPGKSVLVDDGKCPAGEVSKVTGATSLTGSRGYACVTKPKS